MKLKQQVSIAADSFQVKIYLSLYNMPQKYSVAYIINEQQWYTVQLHIGILYRWKLSKKISNKG